MRRKRTRATTIDQQGQQQQQQQRTTNRDRKRRSSAVLGSIIGSYRAIDRIMFLRSNMMVAPILLLLLSFRQHRDQHLLAAEAFSPPVYGIGGLINPVRNVRVTTAAAESAGNANNIRTELAQCADFFVDAFWSSKLSLPSSSPSSSSKSSWGATIQRESLYQQQWAEFTKRYGNVNKRRRNSELIVLKRKQQKSDDSTDEEIIGIVGVEIDKVKLDPYDPYSETISVPLMSNLAIAKTYRRRGLAEKLVSSAERVVRDGGDWDDNTCLYLYVEQKNQPAVQLYRKLGYRVVWKNNQATSVRPTVTGTLATTTTTVVCMKKQLIPNTPKRFVFF